MAIDSLLIGSSTRKVLSGGISRIPRAQCAISSLQVSVHTCGQQVRLRRSKSVQHRLSYFELRKLIELSHARDASPLAEGAPIFVDWRDVHFCAAYFSSLQTNRAGNLPSNRCTTRSFESCILVPCTGTCVALRSGPAPVWSHLPKVLEYFIKIYN